MTVRLQLLAERFARLRRQNPDVAIVGAWTSPRCGRWRAPGSDALLTGPAFLAQGHHRVYRRCPSIDQSGASAVTSCRQGHPVSAESGFCEICGDDVRPRCSQGHRSVVGARFCETCGEPLAGGPGPRRFTRIPSRSSSTIAAGLSPTSSPGTSLTWASAAATDQRNPALRGGH